MITMLQEFKMKLLEEGKVAKVEVSNKATAKARSARSLCPSAAPLRGLGLRSRRPG